MGNVNSDNNQSAPPPEDLALSLAMLAKSVFNCADDATKATSTAAETSSAMSSNGNGRTKLPDSGRTKLPDSENQKKIKLLLNNIHSRSAEGVSETPC